MIRVLQINAGSKNFGGVSALLLNIWRHIDRTRISFDFLTPNITTYEAYREEIQNGGGHIYQFGINSSSLKGKKKLQRALKTFLDEHEYDIIHINSGVLLFNYMVAAACRKYSKAKIIVHSHNNGGRSGMKDKFSAPLKGMLCRKADLLLSISQSSSEYMFTKEKARNGTILVKNGIDAKKFRFRPEVREKLRRELKIDHQFVIGNIGRFMPQKNHSFMLEVFASLLKQCPDSVLMLIGEGELTDQVKQQAKALGVENQVLFLGRIKNVEDYYQAMDVFFLPSIFEGLGIVNIEAQSAGLECIVSDVVAAEANAAGMVRFLSLKAPVEEWVAALLSAKGQERRDCSDLIIRAGYDIAATGKALEKIYTDLMK